MMVGVHVSDVPRSGYSPMHCTEESARYLAENNEELIVFPIIRQEDFNIPHKCSLKLVKVKGARSHSRKWGGTLTFECDFCHIRRVFKRYKVHSLVLGRKKRFNRSSHESGRGYWV